MIHVDLHSVGTYHKKFGRQNSLCRVFRTHGKEADSGSEGISYHFINSIFEVVSGLTYI
jgi:hypothetical protein